MRTVLVTGGAGFIGSHLVDRLLDGGATVRVLDNLATGSLSNLQAAAEGHARTSGGPSGGRLEVIIGDVRDRELVRKALRNVKYVFHLAALPASAVRVTESAEIHAVNVEGTLNLLHGALTEGVWRVVMGSCASVYGVPDVIPVSEETRLRPNSLFGASKVAAETYCHTFYARHQLETVVLRYFSIYGPRQRAIRGESLVPRLIEALRKGRAVEGIDDRNSDDLIYVSDAVAATLAASRAPRAAGRVINIGLGEMVSTGDVVRILCDLLRAPVARKSEAHRDVSVSRMCALTSVAAELLSFSPRVSLITGLARMVREASEAEQPVFDTFARVGGND